MTSNEYRQQLAAIGDAAAAEVDVYHRKLRKIVKALDHQRKRVTVLRDSAAKARGYFRDEYQAEAMAIESVVKAIERAME